MKLETKLGRVRDPSSAQNLGNQCAILKYQLHFVGHFIYPSRFDYLQPECFIDLGIEGKFDVLVEPSEEQSLIGLINVDEAFPIFSIDTRHIFNELRREALDYMTVQGPGINIFKVFYYVN